MRLGVGQVAISGSDHTLVALAGDQAMERKLAWQQGRLEFDQTPLSDVLEEVNRYSDQPIRLASDALQGIRVSGSFETRNTTVFLRSLEQGFGLVVQRTSNGWLLSKAP
jgi:transmembrane sensor